jgi:hypothetical protein
MGGTRGAALGNAHLTRKDTGMGLTRWHDAILILAFLVAFVVSWIAGISYQIRKESKLTPHEKRLRYISLYREKK